MTGGMVSREILLHRYSKPSGNTLNIYFDMFSKYPRETLEAPLCRLTVMCCAF
jgi:hypothetical protein